jgi:hypothetical protein
MKLIQLTVIGAADNYPNTPLLVLDIKANPTPEMKGQQCSGIELDCIVIVLVNSWIVILARVWRQHLRML